MKFSIIALLATVSISIFAQPEIKFNKKVQKNEKVKAGEILGFAYLFENTGTEPLIISEVKVTCDCTKPRWPKHPIMPGKSDTINVTVNTSKMIGWQDRTLEIFSNAKNSQEKIRFKVMVNNK